MKKLKIKRVTVITCIIAAGFIYALFFMKTGVGIPCLFRLQTGYLCPSCGTTRMISSLLSLDFELAFYYNPLMFVLLPIFIYFALSFSIRYIKTGRVNTHRFENVIFISIVIVMIIFAVIRNLE